MHGEPGDERALTFPLLRLPTSPAEPPPPGRKPQPTASHCRCRLLSQVLLSPVSSPHSPSPSPLVSSVLFSQSPPLSNACLGKTDDPSHI